MTSKQKSSILNAVEMKPKSKNIAREDDVASKPASRKMVKQTDVEETDESAESFNKMKLIKENLFLLSQIDKLKQTNSTLTQKIYYLESLTRVSSK